ncbi:hypothetical protein CY0110_16592 [Crocosphaera chwakensis CCY0110]|uniref:Uncharacterized protein n=1 Tax=Crocosphaera chwakensis CCY0110 TaxID=391612 RepID=A3II00_9CHRO|nr:hypothetical protein CY0110_16592 [Crocosphaera chwakensis CCY0110]
MGSQSCSFCWLNLCLVSSKICLTIVIKV